MAMFTSYGQPDDSVGAANDYAIDPANRFLWGPKTTTWAGTAISIVGPTGPGLLAGQGAPAAGTGIVGNAYVDTLTGDLWGPKTAPASWPASPSSNLMGPAGSILRYGTGPASSSNPPKQADGDSYIDQQANTLSGPRANGVWPAPISLVGPPGPTLDVLTSQSVGLGPSFSCTVAVGTTPVNGVYPGTTQPVVFAPTYGSALMGLSYTNPGGAVTLSLVDQTTSSVVYSVSATGNLTSNAGQFAVNQYPMVANHQYVWQVTSSTAATANIWVQPMYLMPAASPSYNVSSVGTAQKTNTTFTATQINLTAGGSTVAQSYKFPKAGAVYSVTANNTNAAALTIYLSNAAGTKILTLTAPANAITTFGPYTASQYPMVANTQYYWLVSGSGTGSIFIDMQMLFSVA